MTNYAYLDASGFVLSLSRVVRTLEEVQVKVPSVITIIIGAPAELKAKDDLDPVNYLYYQKTSGDGTDISHYTTAENLEPLRQLRYKEIDAADEALIHEGYEWPPTSGNWFSLSNNAQKKLLSLAVMHDWPELTYPAKMSFKDDSLGTYDVADSAEMRNVCLTAMGTVEAIVIAGDALKTSVRTASTKAEIDAVVDLRLAERDMTEAIRIKEAKLQLKL